MSTTWFEYFLLDDKVKLSDEHVKLLMDMRPETPHEIVVCGRRCKTARLQQAFGVSYKFSGAISVAKEIPEFLKPLMEAMSSKYNCNFNGLLINWYRNGEDFISEHSDNEKDLKPLTPILTVSLGAERDFVLRDKISKVRTITRLQHNSVFVMGGTSQQTHTHGLPKRKRVADFRISITMREFIQK